MLISLEFIEIESPRFVTFDFDGSLPDFDNFTGDIVRVRYTATREQDAAIDKDWIRQGFLAAGASRVTIEPTVTREVRARVETLTQELGPLEALHMYADAQGLDEATNGRMVERLREWIA